MHEVVVRFGPRLKCFPLDREERLILSSGKKKRGKTEYKKRERKEKASGHTAHLHLTLLSKSSVFWFYDGKCVPLQ
ncbi:Hypothetical predicted protein [Scomber scombrus]|uniref:Uncharacterized protein n=1 Tax=Scomber scombrus TaxID=13677 RepID=A0AAV1PNU1_SCOSC